MFLASGAQMKFKALDEVMTNPQEQKTFDL